MTPHRWQQVSALLDQARGLSQEERSAFLLAACDDDSNLRHEVEALLALDEQPTLIDQPIFSIHRDDPEVDRRIGPYQTLRLLGRGGMGAVYLAVRQDDFAQQVALKLIKRGMDSDEILRRFQNERQILANLDHPNIARLLDGGTAADGRPYFVMEYIEGEPMDRYCDHHGLSVGARLDLFRQVCSAVHLSHQNLVVHRDLKPGNILVTHQDGVPKLLDFGIAKLLEPGLAYTVPGHQPMTFKYASPEQVLGERITTASDTFSLGVLLYRLLTGRNAHGLDDLRAYSTDHIRQRICQHEPTKPSLAASRPPAQTPEDDFRGVEAESAPAPFGLEPKHLRRRLAGDLDAIILKALRKEPHRRYGSVLELSEDIRRHQDGLPVVARKGTLPYLAAKFLRRNRLPLAVMLLIFCFGAFSTLLWRRAETQRHEAVMEGSRADRAVQFLVDLFESSDPNQSKGEPLTARDILERGKARYASALEDDPRLLGELADVLSRVYRNLGLYEDAREVMESSLQELRLRSPGDSHEMAKRINNLGTFYYDQGDLEKAEDRFREAWEMRQRLGQKDAEAVRNMNNLAAVLTFRGEFAEAEALYRKGLDIRQRLDGPEHSNVATSLRHVAYVLHLQGEEEQAESLLRRALAIRQRFYEPDDTRVASVLTKLAAVLSDQGRAMEAEVLYLEALTIQQERLGDDHLQVARTQKELAALLLSRLELSAEELQTIQILLAQALGTFGRHRPLDDPDIADTESLLGTYLLRRGEYDEAEPCLIESYGRLEAKRTVHVLYTPGALDRILDLYRVWDKPERAAVYQALKKGPRGGQPMGPKESS